jgi:hypothetical protein
LQFTVRCDAGHDPRLDEVCRVFPSMTRTSYNRLLEDKTQREIELGLLERYGVRNLLWRRNAIIQAKSIIESQRKLLPLYVEKLEWKIQRVKKKLERTRNPLKRHGYKARIQKLERRKARFEAHIKDGTLPKVVFGGRRHIGSEQWRLKRRGQFLSVGDAWNKGNLNTRIHRDGESFSLEIRNWHGGEFFKVPLHAPNAYRRIFTAIADGQLQPLHPLKTENGRRPYTVRVIRRSNRYDCHVSFEVPDQPLQAWNGEKLASIDVNPTHIDVAIVNRDGNLIAAKSFKESALIYARKDKRLWLASNLIEKALKWIRFFGADAVVVEDNLKLSGVEHGKAANRLIANFMHRKQLELIALKALKRELILVRVPAAYSSRIAAAKYKPIFPRISVHQLAAFVLGRRALGLTEHLGTEQLKAVAWRVRKRQAWVKALFLTGHGHPYLKPRIPADGRIGMQDAKGKDAFDEWVTPDTRYAAKAMRMQRLSWLMPTRHWRRRVEAIRDDGWTRAHGGNVPSADMRKST